MACHEIAALRLGLARILGRDNEDERRHDVAELGDAAHREGPLQSLSTAEDFQRLRSFFDSALSDLEKRVAETAPDDAQRPYLLSLILLTKKVELDLENQIDSLMRFYRNLDDIHDFMHDMYPGDSDASES